MFELLTDDEFREFETFELVFRKLEFEMLYDREMLPELYAKVQFVMFIDRRILELLVTFVLFMEVLALMQFVQFEFPLMSKLLFPIILETILRSKSVLILVSFELNIVKDITGGE